MSAGRDRRWWFQVCHESPRGILHGRAFVHDRHAEQVEGSIEWCLLQARPQVLRSMWQIRLGRNGSESDVGLDLSLGPLAGIYLRARAPWLKRARVTKEQDPKHWFYARHYSVQIGGGPIVAMELGALDHHRSRSDPWWQHAEIWPRHIWGKTFAREVIEETGTTVVPMPEGAYQATWTRHHYTRGHVRWPGTWLDRIRPHRPTSTYKLDVEDGIPHEGKGENSWDCGMDGTYGISGPFLALEDAVAGMTRTVLRDRSRYGGPDNLPRPMTVQEATAWQTTEVDDA